MRCSSITSGLIHSNTDLFGCQVKPAAQVEDRLALTDPALQFTLKDKDL